jgi:hypothetical protein
MIVGTILRMLLLDDRLRKRDRKVGLRNSFLSRCSMRMALNALVLVVHENESVGSLLSGMLCYF